MIELIFGIIGMSLILIAFFMDEFYYKKFNQDTVQYNLLNIIGSGCLMFYAITLVSWPFIILNTAWLITASVKLVRILSK
jgi:hypothetical protein